MDTVNEEREKRKSLKSDGQRERWRERSGIKTREKTRQTKREQ